MDRAAIAVLITLVVYKIVLLTIGVVAERRTRDEGDFLLGGRALGPLVAAISASASSSSAWTLLGVSGFAFQNGLVAAWLFPACVGGFALNWFVVAPRLRRRSAADGSLTPTEFLAGPHRGPGFGGVRVAATAIVAFSLTFYVASQFQGAGKSLANAFDLGRTQSVCIGGLIVVLYTVLGGFWAVSLTDTLQGLMMAGTALVLPLAALSEVGGLEDLIAGVRAVDQEGFASWMGAPGDISRGGPWLVLALLGIGIGYPGQPHVVNRFMALRDERSLTQARRYAMVWAVVVYSGMIVLGLAGRVLLGASAGDNEQVFLELTQSLFPPVVAGIMLAAVLSAIMSTADSQLLVVAAAVSHDLDWKGKDERSNLRRTRLIVAAVSVVAIVLALKGSQKIFSSVLFAWSAIGSAFGPLLLVTLWRGAVGPTRTLASMLLGFGLSVLAYNGYFCGLESKGTAVERVLPFVVATVVLLEPGARLRGVRRGSPRSEK